MSEEERLMTVQQQLNLMTVVLTEKSKNFTVNHIFDTLNNMQKNKVYNIVEEIKNLFYELNDEQKIVICKIFIDLGLNFE